jgi:hypothetical protein
MPASDRCFEIYAMQTTVRDQHGTHDHGISLEWASDVDEAISVALATRNVSPFLFSILLNAIPGIDQAWTDAQMGEAVKEVLCITIREKPIDLEPTMLLLIDG